MPSLLWCFEEKMHFQANMHQTRAVDGIADSHWFMAFSSILVIYGKQLELDGS